MEKQTIRGGGDAGAWGVGAGAGPWGALAAFTMHVRRGCKKDLIQVVKLPRTIGQPSGVAVEIVEKHWEAVKRLFGGRDRG